MENKLQDSVAELILFATLVFIGCLSVKMNLRRMEVNSKPFTEMTGQALRK